MKKSNIFTGAERTLNIIEYQMDRLRDEYKEAIEEYNITMEGIDSESEYMVTSRTDAKESAEVALTLIESAYNYIFENFHKITKEM